MSAKNKLNGKKTKEKPEVISKPTKKKVKVDDDGLTKKDVALIEESFNMVKSLNDEISKIHKVKESLKDDISKLKTKVASHESKSKGNREDHQNIYNKIFVALKEEMIKDFLPLIKKLDIKSAKVDIFSEINKVIEVEAQKLKSEFDLKSSKSHREFVKKLSDLEVKVIENINNNEKLKSEIKKLGKTNHIDLNGEIEEKIRDSVKRANQRFITVIDATNIDIDKIKEILNLHEKQYKVLEKRIEDFKRYIKDSLIKDNVDISSIDSKVKQLESEIEGIKSLVERYENDLYSREKKELSEIDKRIAKLLEVPSKDIANLKEVAKEHSSDIKKSIKLIHVEKEALEKFLVEKYNQIVDDVDKLKKELLEKSLEEIGNLKGNFETDLSKLLDEKIAQTLGSLVKEKEVIDEEFGKFKFEVSDVVKNYIEQIDKEIGLIKKEEISMDTKFNNAIKKLNEEKEKERDFVVKKINDVVNNFNELSKKSSLNFKKLRGEFASEIDLFLQNVEKAAKDKVSKEIISNGEFLTKMSLENKEDKRCLVEDIESKFLSSKSQYEADFNSHLKSFDTKLKKKEGEFLEKLKVVEEEKVEMLKELESFKSEVGILTKDYINRLNEELENIKTEKVSFEDEKHAFLSTIDVVVNGKKLELLDYYNDIEKKVSDIVKEEKEAFEKNENTFREIFVEKVSTLKEVLEKKINSIEKKFVDKNLKYVTDKLEKEMEFFKLYEERLVSKEEELSKKVEIIEDSQTRFFAEIEAEKESIVQKIDSVAAPMKEELTSMMNSLEEVQNNLTNLAEEEKNEINEKVETRLVNLEKHFNKRFLDYDSMFSSFKGIVIEEVEDLIKEVNSITNSRVEKFDKTIAKLNFVSSEIQKNFGNLKEVHTLVEAQIRDIRDEVSDYKAKLELFHDASHHSLNDHVEYMREYENQLLGLIKSLKHQGISRERIIEVLINKGHPRFYVMSVVNMYNELHR